MSSNRRLCVLLATLTGLAAALLVAQLAGGWGWARSTGTQQPDAARAVAALAGGSTPVRFPADFASVLGYAPAVEPVNGSPAPVRADGGCSSPWGATSYDFGAPCRQHDLGYDLLRYAGLKGQPLGAWARRAVDGHFHDELAERCGGGLRCSAVAAFYVDAVRFNSWRQGWGVPVVEPLDELLAPVFAGVFAGVVAGVLVGASRVRRRGLSFVRTAVASPRLLGRAGSLLVAASVLALCLQPASVPRPLWAQALIAGAAAGQAYLLGGPFGGLFARVPGRRWRVAALALIPVVLGWGAVAAVASQLRLLGEVGRSVPVPGTELLAVPLAAAVAALLVLAVHGVLRVVTRGTRALVSGLARPVGRRLAAVLLVPGLVIGVGTAEAAAAAPFAPVASGVPSRSTEMTPQTAESLCFGSACRAELGAKGRQFLSGTTPAGPGASAPVRVYVGRDQASSARARAALAVAELERAGGFDKSVLLLAVPTGSGWVNPEAVAELELLRHGDVASVAVQYAASPSWLAYVRGGEGVQATVRALVSAVHEQVAARPASKRPTVLLYGESLGAWGGLNAYPDRDRLFRQVDGALWVGVPSGAGAHLSGADEYPERVVVHPDDPVPAWTPALMVHPVPEWHHQWLPFVSFWRATADVVSALNTPAGHGHRYGAELADDWRALTVAA